MKRRRFLWLTFILWTPGSRGQQSTKVPTIGYLSPGSARLTVRDEAFFESLQELGYIEGQNIRIEYRFAEGKLERLETLAAELVEMDVDLIVTVVTQASLAARNATDTIPIVMMGVSDPVGSGLVASLAWPGANVTGTSGMNAELVGKSLEILKEVVPTVSRVAIVWNPGNPVFQAQMLKEAERAAERLELEAQGFAARDADELDRALVAVTAHKMGALMVLADPMLLLYQARIVEFAEKNHLPAIYGIRDFAVSGGLMVYAPNMESQYRRAAVFVDKILKGSKPADLPVEQPLEFELVLNLNAARQLGLMFPSSLIVRADTVIE